MLAERKGRDPDMIELLKDAEKNPRTPKKKPSRRMKGKKKKKRKKRRKKEEESEDADEL